MTDEEWQELERAVEAEDPDRFVATFFAPTRHRRALTALLNFDLEIARVATQVREPMMGHVRLAWWREQIGAIYDGKPPAAPAGHALAEAIRLLQLPRTLIDPIIDARAHDLDETPFATEAEFEAYADATAGNVMRLGARVLGLSETADRAATHAAVAYAYGRELRRLPHNARARRYRLPVRWLTDANLNAEDIFTGASAEALDPRAHARIAFELAAANAARFRPGAMPALSPATLARGAALGKDLTPWQRVTRLAFANLTWRL